MIIELFIFFLGFIIGSFLNVCIYRLPRGESVISPPSHCPACGTRLKPWDLAPVVSYLLLRGRCRCCGAIISLRYVAVELLTGGLFVLCYLAVGLGPFLAKALLLTSFLIVVAFIDYDHRLILDKVLLLLAGTGVLINIVQKYGSVWLPHVGLYGVFFINSLDWFDMAVAALLGGGIMLFLAIVSRGGLGGGDIKFVAALGLWLGWKLTLLVLLLSFLAGGVGGAALLLLRLKGRKDFIPFGPFIAAGAFIGMLYGYAVLEWYLGHFR